MGFVEIIVILCIILGVSVGWIFSDYADNEAPKNRRKRQ